MVSVPAFILLFRISENVEGFRPKLSAMPALVSPLSLNNVETAFIKRSLIAFLSIIAFFNSENCIFLCCNSENLYICSVFKK